VLRPHALESLQYSSKGEVHHDLMVLHALAALHRAEIAHKAVMAVAHSSQAAVIEISHADKMHRREIPSNLDDNRILKPNSLPSTAAPLRRGLFFHVEDSLRGVSGVGGQPMWKPPNPVKILSHTSEGVNTCGEIFRCQLSTRLSGGRTVSRSMIPAP
jgi:hypothetical protein